MCFSILKRKLIDIDEILQQKNGQYSGYSLSTEEINFLFKDAYPKTYIAYIKKDEWFLKIQAEFPQFRKTKQNNKKKPN